MLRKIAIVGANGFVGRHLVEAATAAGIEVIGVVRSEAGADIVQRLGGTPVRVADLSAPSLSALVPLLRGCDGVAYTASVATGPDAVDRTEPAGLANVMASCHTSGVLRFVFFSGLGMAHYGQNPHCTNPYFLAKMAGETALFRSTLNVTVLRPSYIFGAGDEFLTPLLGRVASSDEIEIPGDGAYRLQPISVRDAARVVLGSLAREDAGPRVVDLVGPEIISYRTLIDRIVALQGREIGVVERPLAEALALARGGSYLGLRPNDLACLLCDEVADAHPAEILAGQAFESLDRQIESTIAELRRSGPGA